MLRSWNSREHVLSETITKESLQTPASWPNSARHCVPTPHPSSRKQLPGPASMLLFCSLTLEPISPVRGGARGAVSAAPAAAPGSPPPCWAKASDAGETRAHSAGQRRGLVRRGCMGFLLSTEGCRSSPLTSQAAAPRARPAGTRCRATAALTQLSDSIPRDPGVRPGEL